MADANGKMMLGFVVRRFVADTGCEPSPETFAEWANRYRDGDREVYLFGRPISANEARVILRHRGRPVSARGAQPREAGDMDSAPLAAADTTAPAKVTSLAEARARRDAKRGVPR